MGVLVEAVRTDEQLADSDRVVEAKAKAKRAVHYCTVQYRTVAFHFEFTVIHRDRLES